MAEELVGGIHACEAVLKHGAERIKQCWISSQWEKNKRLIVLVEALQRAGVRFQTLDKNKLDQKAGELRHQGILMQIAAAKSLDEKDLLQQLKTLDHPAFYLVLDSVQDPHNLGACLRTANAVGCDGIILPRDKAAPLNATVRKVAVGAAELTPVFAVTNLNRTLEALKAEGVWVSGTAADTDKTLYEGDFTGPCAVVIGAEGSGLRRMTREHCDFLLKIPMVGQVESLNASVAAAVLMYEVLRQRQIPSKP